MLVLRTIREITRQGEVSAPVGRQRFVLGALLAALFVTTQPTPAFATSPRETVSEASQRNARLHYEAGVAAYRDSRYRDAVASFLAADRLEPRPALAYNIAKTYERLEDTAHALNYYREYLRRDPGAANGAEVRAAVTELQLMLSAQGLQQLTVLSEPSNALVSIDSRPVGATPWTGELRPGQHQLSLRSSLGVEQIFSIDLPRERALELNVRLPPMSAATLLSNDGGNDHSAVSRALVPSNPSGTMVEPSKGPSPALIMAGGALTLVGLGVGIGFELAAQSEDKALTRYKAQLGPHGCVGDENPATCDSVRASAARFDRDKTVSVVGFASASAAALGTLVYWLWTGTNTPARGANDAQHLARLRFDGGVAPGGATFGISSSF